MIKRNDSGFTALVSVIVVGAMLMAIASSANYAGISGRQDSLADESKSDSQSFAESCLNIARLKLVSDKNYTGNENFVLETGSCLIRPFLPVAGWPDRRIAETTSRQNGASTNLRAQIGVNGMLYCLSEIPNWTSPVCL